MEASVRVSAKAFFSIFFKISADTLFQLSGTDTIEDIDRKFRNWYAKEKKKFEGKSPKEKEDLRHQKCRELLKNLSWTDSEEPDKGLCNRIKSYVAHGEEDQKCDLLQIDQKTPIMPEFDRYLCQQCPQFSGSTERLMAYTRYTFYIEQVMKYECEESNNCVVVARSPHSSVTTLAAEARPLGPVAPVAKVVSGSLKLKWELPHTRTGQLDSFIVLVRRYVETPLSTVNRFQDEAMADCVCLTDSSVCEPAGCYEKKYKTFLRDMLVTEEDSDNFVPVDDQVQYSEVETCNKKKHSNIGNIGPLTQDANLMLQKLRNKYEKLEVCDAQGNLCRETPKSLPAKTDFTEYLPSGGSLNTDSSYGHFDLDTGYDNSEDFDNYDFNNDEFDNYDVYDVDSDSSDSSSSQNQSSEENFQETNTTAKIEATPPPKCQLQALLCDTMLKSIHRKDRFEESLSCSSAFNSTSIFNSSYTCNETTTYTSVPQPKSDANYAKCPSPHLCQMFVDQCRLSTLLRLFPEKTFFEIYQNY